MRVSACGGYQKLSVEALYPIFPSGGGYPPKIKIPRDFCDAPGGAVAPRTPPGISPLGIRLFFNFSRYFIIFFQKLKKSGYPTGVSLGGGPGRLQPPREHHKNLSES